jgi:hypothetical protein
MRSLRNANIDAVFSRDDLLSGMSNLRFFHVLRFELKSHSSSSRHISREH